jgi:hypothetical protein
MTPHGVQIELHGKMFIMNKAELKRAIRHVKKHKRDYDNEREWYANLRVYQDALAYLEEHHGA